MDGSIYISQSILPFSDKNKLRTVLNNFFKDESGFANIPKQFNLVFLKELHKYIFGDMHDSPVEDEREVSEECIKAIEALNEKDWLYLSLKEKASAITDFLYKIINLNPFLFGTYQAAILYISSLAKIKGFAFDQECIDINYIVLENNLMLDDLLSREEVISIIEEAIEINFCKINTLEAVNEVIEKAGFKAEKEITENMKLLNQCMFKIYTINEIYDLYKYPEKLGEGEQKIVSSIGSGFAFQETLFLSPKNHIKEPEYIHMPEL